MGIRQVIETIRKTNSFLITSHTNLEGDALGSELAFMYLLKALGKKTVIVNDEECPDEYRFLPGVNFIRKLKPKKMRDMAFEAFVALDCSDLGRCRAVADIIPQDKIIINIDHHISNKNFGDVNWVDSKASCVCEMVYQLYKEMSLPLDSKKALCLYTGILTDTGSFHHPNTTAKTHAIASELIRYGLDINAIYRNVYESVNFADMQLLIQTLNTIKFDKKNGIVFFSIKRDFLKRRKLSFDLTEQILTFGRLLKDMKAAVLFKENLDKTNQIRVNLRSKGKVNVSRIARVFGGGGHRNASACTVHGSLEAAQRKVLKEIIRLLNV